MADRDQWYDRSVTYSQDGRGITVKPADVLMRAARLERDGKTLREIRVELALGDWVSDQHLRNALKRGHQMLREAIARGEEPAESRILVPGDANFEMHS